MRHPSHSIWFMYNMQTMHIEDLDFGEIRLIAALSELRKLSAAAARLGLSQSAASHALARLRNRTGDPLFVRGSRRFLSDPLWRAVEHGRAQGARYPARRISSQRRVRSDVHRRGGSTSM